MKKITAKRKSLLCESCKEQIRCIRSNEIKGKRTKEVAGFSERGKH